MKRRTVLSAVAAGPLAGCLTGASGLGEHDDPGTDSPGQSAAADTPTWGACPSFVDDAERTVCWTDRGDADVYLQPSSLRFAESETYQAIDTVTFMLVNGSDGEVRLNPYDWAVERPTDDDWSRVAPTGTIVEPLYVLPAGRSYEWVLATTRHPSSNADRRQDIVADLPAEGAYAFRLHGTVGDGEDATHVEWVARFEYVRSDQG